MTLEGISIIELIGSAIGSGFAAWVAVRRQLKPIVRQVVREEAPEVARLVVREETRELSARLNRAEGELKAVFHVLGMRRRAEDKGDAA